MTQTITPLGPAKPHLSLIAEQPLPLHLDEETWFCSCPACKGQAKKRRWEQIDAGSINVYTQVSCDCGYAWSSENGISYDPRLDPDFED